MSDKIKLTCPRCGHKWEQSLRDLEKMGTIFKSHLNEETKPDTAEYRAVCPADGTYVIVEVQED